MVRILARLSGPSSNATKHYIVPAKGGAKGRIQMAEAKFLVIEGMPEKPETGALLYRFDEVGECIGDSWHSSIEAAQKNAESEYEGVIGEWNELPDAANVRDFIN